MIHSFLLIGQSNMAGRGFFSEAMPIDPTHIQILRNGRWQPMFRPINPDRSFSGVNLAESFAERYAEKYGVDVGLICCADGGTRLDQWEAGSLLFENAVTQAKLAQRTSYLAGILWHQGESDCREELYKTYEARLTDFVNAIRTELNASDVPFLLGGLGEFLKDYPQIGAPKKDLDVYSEYYPHINEATRQVAEKLPLAGFVPADGLGSNPDNLHFHAKALYEFGIRYFEKFEEIVPKERIIRETDIYDDSRRTNIDSL